jgi:putrescine importer
LQTLKSNGVGLAGAATLGVVMLSPAMTLYGNFGAAFSTAGHGAPLAFVWGLLATLPTAFSYALLSRERPSSGSAAAWTAQALSSRAARWVGWMVFLYYLTNFILQPVTLGLFFNDLLNAAGVHTSVITYGLGALLCCALPALIAYRGITPSVEGALAFLIFEALVVAALCFSVVRGAPALDLHGFSLAGTSASGIFRAMVFAMLSYCGFDVVSTLAEEARMPRKLIPQATFLSLAMFGVLVIGGIWCLTFAETPERLRALADSGGMPITEIARGVWGRGALLVMLTGVSAALGIAIATAVGASRILFAMGRDGLAPGVFAALRNQVPWNAMHLIFGAGFLGAVVVGAMVGPYSAYLWWGTTSTFFAMLTFVFVNLANLVLHRSQVFSSPLNFVLYGALPAAGVTVDVVILWRSFFVELWAQPWATGRSVIVFDVACAALALLALLPPLRATAPAAD